MVDSSNLPFYKTSYHLNTLLLEAIGKEIHGCGVMGEMAIKVISCIFEQQLRTGENIGDYYIMIKAMILLRKEFFVDLIYAIFEDLLTRRILSREQLCTLLVMIEFEAAEAKISFVCLT